MRGRSQEKALESISSFNYSQTMKSETITTKMRREASLLTTLPFQCIVVRSCNEKVMDVGKYITETIEELCGSTNFLENKIATILPTSLIKQLHVLEEQERRKKEWLQYEDKLKSISKQW